MARCKSPGKNFAMQGQTTFITPEEIEELTGYVRRPAQTRWLERHSFSFTLTRSGRPIVLRAEMERHLLGNRQATKPMEDCPHWDRIA
ncbi:MULTISPECIES: DUF4224 domain-containing protein [Acidithiobacillus]|jgi:hypothetical protein|uniref:DUF4224 domain-containing protein n=2 Tax=Acidithiobacillaceae TaxID=225058 RepID=UPI0034A5D2ED